MAQKVVTTLTDDLDGGKANETVPFALGNAHYQIDLSTKHAAAMRKAFAPYVEHARKVTQSSQPARRRALRDRQHSAEVREWAKANGITISERGRIPASVISQYEEARG
jgi:Lsr2